MNKKGTICWVLGWVLALAAIGLYIGYAVLLSETGARHTVQLAGAIILTVAALPLIIYGFIKFSPDKALKERMARYSNLPANPIDDYAKELEQVRENFAADTADDKNVVDGAVFAGTRHLYDYSVLQSGKIVYAYVLRTFPAMTSSKNLARPTLPAVVVYGTDEYFEKNPQELRKIAVAIRGNAFSNIMKDDANMFANAKVPAALCDGRDVYLTTTLACRKHLPLLCVSGPIVPLIANPTASQSTFIADVKYWTEPLIAHFCRGTI